MQGLSLPGLLLGVAGAGTPTPTPSYTTLTEGPGIKGITLSPLAFVTAGGKLFDPNLMGTSEFGGANTYGIQLTGTNIGFREKHSWSPRFYYTQPVDNHAINTALLLPGNIVMVDSIPHDGATGTWRVTTGDVDGWWSYKQPQTFAAPAGFNVVAYSKLNTLASNSSVYRIFRATNTTLGTRPTFLNQDTIAAVLAGTATFATSTKIIEYAADPTQRPYSVDVYDAANDRVVVYATQGHVEEIATLIGAFYFKNVGGVNKFYRLGDDVDVTASLPLDPTNPAHMTQIAGSSPRKWPYQAVIDTDGNPKVLFATVAAVGNIQNTNGTIQSAKTIAGVTSTVTVISGQYSYPSGQNGVWYPSNYGQAGYDPVNPSRVVVCDTSVMSGTPTVAAADVKIFTVNEVAGTSTLLKTVKTGGNNLAPYVPLNHQGLVEAQWSFGTFPAYNAFDTVEQVSSVVTAFAAPTIITPPTGWTDYLGRVSFSSNNNRDLVKFGFYELNQLSKWLTTDIFMPWAFLAAYADCKQNGTTGSSVLGADVGTGATFAQNIGLKGTGSGSGNYMVLNNSNPAALTNYGQNNNAMIIHAKGMKYADPTANLVAPIASPAQDIIQSVTSGGIRYRSSNPSTDLVTAAGSNQSMPASTGYDGPPGYLDGIRGYRRFNSTTFSAFFENLKILSRSDSTSASKGTNNFAPLRDCPTTVSMGLLWAGADPGSDDLYAQVSDIFSTMMFNVG